MSRPLTLQDANVLFCRRLLGMTLDEVRPLTTPAERKRAWVWHSSALDHWEFHGPDGYYWHGRADNAYHARQQGWAAWLEHLHREHVDMVTRLQGTREREAQALRTGGFRS
jgi:hypothetical protein